MAWGNPIMKLAQVQERRELPSKSETKFKIRRILSHRGHRVHRGLTPRALCDLCGLLLLLELVFAVSISEFRISPQRGYAFSSLPIADRLDSFTGTEECGELSACLRFLRGLEAKN